MKILIYSHFFPPSVGGVEKTTVLLARYLHEEGEKVSVVTRTLAKDPPDFPFQVVRNPSFRQLALDIRRCDIVHLQGFVLLPFFLAKANGKPVVWVHHGYDLTCPKQIGWNDGSDTSFRFSQCAKCLLRDHSPIETLGLMMLLRLKRLFKRFADTHAAPSQYLLNREGLKGEVVPNAVDTQLYSPGPDEKVYGRILFVGRLIEEKGVAVLLRAFDRLTKRGGNYTLEIVGDGYELQGLRRAVAKSGLERRVIFAGSVAEAELLTKIRRASVVCAPTLNAEPFGIVGLEAMSCATPLVASGRGGFVEYSKGTAFLVPPGDEEALAKALEEATSRSRSADRAQAGRQHVVDCYDYRVVGARYLQLYRELVRGK